MPKRDDGPRSELARYAFGWSDEKPSTSYWVIVLGMVLAVVFHFVVLFQ